MSDSNKDKFYRGDEAREPSYCTCRDTYFGDSECKAVSHYIPEKELFKEPRIVPNNRHERRKQRKVNDEYNR